MESKGIDCHSIMCGCTNTRTGCNPQLCYAKSSGIRDGVETVTFDQFYELMSEKVKDSN